MQAAADCQVTDYYGSGLVTAPLLMMAKPRTPTHMGIIANTLRATLHDLAASDARLYRGLATELATPAARPALPADEIAAAIALLESHGYTVTGP
jgi:hypothetical protein